MCRLSYVSTAPEKKPESAVSHQMPAECGGMRIQSDFTGARQAQMSAGAFRQSLRSDTLKKEAAESILSGIPDFCTILHHPTLR